MRLITMPNLFAQAQAAAQEEDWAQVNHCLQQLLTGKTTSTRPLETPALALALDLALDVLAAGDFSDRWTVAKLFPRLGPSAIAPLIALVESDDAEIETRWFAARTLGEFDDPGVVSALVKVLQSSNDEDLNDITAKALAQLGPSAVPALTALLAAEDSRLLAARSLGQIRDSGTIAPLLGVVHDPQAAVRATAIETLGSFHDARIPPVLIHALSDPAAQVRRAAVVSLGFRPDLSQSLDLVGVIQPLLGDVNLDVCQQAAASLGRLGSSAAATALFQVLQASTSPVELQAAIARALGRIETPQSLTYLQQVLGAVPTPVCEEIAVVCGRMEQPHLQASATQILMDLLQTQHPPAQAPAVRQAIATSLGQLGQAEAIDSLIKLLANADAGVRLHAIAALKKLAPADQVRNQLKDLAQANRLTPELQHGVAIALSEWQHS